MQKSITDAAIKGWIDNKETGTNTQANITSKNVVVNPVQKSKNNAVSLSQDFIYAAKTGESLDKLLSSLENLDYSSLTNMLRSDNEKKAFWINIYNGFSNSILKKNTAQYSDRNEFFKAKQISLAGKIFSLDEIEHDFLRRTKIKWSLGYLGKIFSSKIAKELRVQQLDYRIHFALNCGAKSCPPIAYYSPEPLDQQLEIATKNYLNSEAEYNKEENILFLPAIMSWFRADFGGKKGMKNIVEKYQVFPFGSDPKIEFKKYDWTLELDNYKIE